MNSEGGAVDLADNPAALCRWMIGGPEVARLCAEFQGVAIKKEITAYHEQTKGFQRSFANDVQRHAATIEEMGNPFLEESKDLVHDTETLLSRL